MSIYLFHQDQAFWLGNKLKIQDDIGTVQIPTKLKQHFEEGFIDIDHAFGRESQTKILSRCQLVIRVVVA